MSCSLKPLMDEGPTASELIHQIVIEQESEVTAPSGDLTLSWSTFDTVRAKIEPLRGRDLWNAAQVQPDISHRITIRYRANVTSKMRIVFGSRTFHIEGPPKNLEERNQWLVLMCKEIE